MTRREAIRALRRIDARKDHVDARAAAIEIAVTSEDPLILAVARCQELYHSRGLGQVERALVAGAELLPLLDQLRAPANGDETWALSKVADGLEMAVYCGLDVPEVSFSAIDALIDAYVPLLRLLGLREYAVLQLRARRFFVSGDQERCAATIEALMPHVNYTNGSRQRLGCPGCVLNSVVWYLGPTAELALLEEMLAPIFEGRYFDFPNEDPAVIRSIRDRNQRCENALGVHMHYARALMWRGRAREAMEHSEYARREDLGECYLLPTIFFLEVAMVGDDPERIRERIRLLRPRVKAHEDAQEAMLGAIRCAQALALLDEDPEDQARLWEIADGHARRLDARLERPRHRAEVATERADGAPFLRAPRVEPP